MEVKPMTGFKGLLFFLCLTLLFSCKKGLTDPENQPPRVTLSFLDAATGVVESGGAIKIQAEIDDDGGLDSVETEWKITAGTFLDSEKEQAEWQAPDVPGIYIIHAKAMDSDGLVGADSITVTVGNNPPMIVSVRPLRPTVILGNTITFRASAVDPDGHALQLDWEVKTGEIVAADADSMVWRAPPKPIKTDVTVTAFDPFYAISKDTLQVSVYREVGSIWVADTGNRQIVKVSAEGEILIKKEGFDAPVSITTDAVRRATWVVDYGGHAIHVLALNGVKQGSVTGLGGPVELAISEVNGHAWVVEQDSNCVAEISNNGLSIVRRIKGFRHPSAIAIDQRNGDVYIADTGSHQVIRLSRDIPNRYTITTDTLYHETFSGFDAPMDLASEFHSQNIWVVDKFLQTVYTIKERRASRLGVTGLRMPTAVAIDNTAGIAWIADTGSGRIVKIDHNNILTQVDGFLVPHDLVVDPIDGSVWIADTENDRIVKLSRDGTEIFSVYGFSSPRGLGLNSGH